MGDPQPSRRTLSAQDIPNWLIQEAPPWARPYVGHRALPEPLASRPGLLATKVGALDHWQANHFVVHRPETAAALYRDYTPLTVAYRPGSLPGHEKLVARHTAGLTDDRAKALSLLQAVAQALPHPTIPPLGPYCRADRNLDDEPLLASGAGFCNEQARVFVRLCQVAGIPARLVFLFYSHHPTGHVVAEFFTGGHWAMADASWFCVFPAADGALLSAAQCHQPSSRQAVGETYFQCMQRVLALTDEQLVGRSLSDPQPEDLARQAAPLRTVLAARTHHFCSHWLWAFGLLNYPLPQ